MYMWEEAQLISFLGMDVYAWGLFAAVGAFGMLLLLCALSAMKKMQGGTAPVMFLLSTVLGLVCSRVLYALFSFNVDVPLLGKLHPLFITGGGHSMMGALLGGFLGAALTAKVQKEKALKYLDMFAVAALGFVFFARLGEMFVEDFGISRSLVYEFTARLPIAIQGEYDSCLATYLLEAICAIVMLGILLHDVKKQQTPGNTFVLFLLLFGASQIVMESLRYDRHMSFTFIRMQQIMAILVLTGGLIYAAKRAGKGKKTLFMLFCMMVLISAVGVGLEFAIDRTEINRYLLYLALVVLVSIPVCMGLKLRKKGT